MKFQFWLTFLVLIVLTINSSLATKEEEQKEYDEILNMLDGEPADKAKTEKLIEEKDEFGYWQRIKTFNPFAIRNNSRDELWCSTKQGEEDACPPGTRLYFYACREKVCCVFYQDWVLVITSLILMFVSFSLGFCCFRYYKKHHQY